MQFCIPVSLYLCSLFSAILRVEAADKAPTTAAKEKYKQELSMLQHRRTLHTNKTLEELEKEERLKIFEDPWGTLS